MFTNTMKSLLLSFTTAASALCQLGLPATPTLPTFPTKLTIMNSPLVIASIGDSNAAGEGVPNSVGSSPSIWSLAQCHRSENNGRTLAANALDRVTDLEYSNFACSGGSINTGLLGPYVGMPVNGTFRNALPAQVQQVKDWMNADTRRSKLDVLIVSIGVNDSGFGHVVGACLDPTGGLSDHPGDCSGNTHLKSIIADGDADNATVVLGLNRLGDALDQLADTIKTQLHPTYVLLTEYPNPVHDEKGYFCNAYDEHFEVAPQHLTYGNIEPVTGIMKWLEVGGAMKNVHNYESQFMEQSLINPLNTQLQKAVQRHAQDGWIYVGGIVEMSLPHGYCSKSPWVNTLKASFNAQGDVDGTAHLNKSGQKAYQWLLQKKIVELFRLQAPPVEVADVQVTNVYIGDRKRVVVEVSPTTDFVSGEVMYKLRTTQQAALIQNQTATLKRDTSYTFRQVYYADLPGTETLGYEENFYYAPVIHYGPNQNTLNGFIGFQPKEYVVFRYQEISSN